MVVIDTQPSAAIGARAEGATAALAREHLLVMRDRESICRLQTRSAQRQVNALPIVAIAGMPATPRRTAARRVPRPVHFPHVPAIGRIARVTLTFPARQDIG